MVGFCFLEFELGGVGGLVGGGGGKKKILNEVEM